MPLAVTHVLSTIIAVDIYRRKFAKHRGYFTLRTVLLAGIGGLLPDIDILVSWLMRLFGYSHPLLEHGGITHTLFFGALFLLPGLFLYHEKKHRKGMYFIVIALGIFWHIFLDFFLGGGGQGGVMFLLPLTMQGFSLGLLSFHHHLPIALDAILLLCWLYYEEVHHKIRSFI